MEVFLGKKDLLSLAVY